MKWRRGNPQKIFRKSEKNWLFAKTSEVREKALIKGTATFYLTMETAVIFVETMS